MLHDIVLAGHGVRLAPLGPEHAGALLTLIDDQLWAGMTPPPTRSAVRPPSTT